ncbi:MAG: MogA/MoaB family molybdenum cofactor biosynthesis protein [Candidatus Wallbacteria bacterium]|nr:MogA/MoaB family molybdenum cofactor biosynthesis protein [Candidatus Wallbacteria bacterium]
MDGARVAILVASDKGSRGERADASGKWLEEALAAAGARVVERRIEADDAGALASAIKAFADGLGVDVVFTCGGTGFTQRDVTPEATSSVIERNVPGIPEAIRAASLRITPMAMLTRGIAGIRGKTLIVNLPGSPKAVRETLDVVFPILPHAIETLRSYTGVDCGGRPPPSGSA